ncbi:EAL domain-containing protein [Salmonella enterica subsp. enterica]|nr:EAL domain-containing protein [Salmonella enterica subsp. enterica]
MPGISIAGLRQALTGHRVNPYGQSLHRTTDGMCVGMEILARMTTDGQGVLSPEQFLPAMESRKLRLPVIKSLMLQTSEWLNHVKHHIPDRFVVSFNVCSGVLNTPEIHTLCRGFISKAPSGVQLCLELTERQSFRYDQQEMENIARLRRMGVRVVLDDFGTGYCNFLLLTNNIDGIKIPKVFISSDGDDSRLHIIERNMLILARELNIDVTAEGVETRAQYERLKGSGVKVLQGYYFSRPQKLDHYVPLPSFFREEYPGLSGH